MSPRLPRATRLPINRCNLPADILGSLTYQRHPTPLRLDGVEELHRGLFARLAAIEAHAERAALFMAHMAAAFCLDDPQAAGHDPARPRRRDRAKADYLRILRGWAFDADGREAAVLKGWVESRFGLLPRHHGGPIRDFSGAAYRHYLEQRSGGLYNTNSLEAQFDLVYAYCQHELGRLCPGVSHLPLYRGVNRIDRYEILPAASAHERAAAQPSGDRRVLLLNSLNSFSRERDRAGEFGDSILEVRVPLPKVFFFQGLLPGKLRGEGEYAVIGGVYEVEVAKS